MKRRKRFLEGFGFILGSLIALFFIWYAYFVLKKASLLFAIFASLFFGSGLLAGPMLLTVRHDESRWFAVDFRYLNRWQNVVLAIGALIFAICSLWFAISREIDLFFEETFGREFPYLVFRMACVIGFFYSCWHAFLKFRQAFHVGESGDSSENR